MDELETGPKDGVLTEVLRAIVEVARDDGDAAIRSVMKDGQVTISRVREERYPPASRRTHKVSDSESLIRAVNQFGEGRHTSTLMLGTQHAVFVVDDYPFESEDQHIPHGERETFTLDFERSREWKNWRGVLNASELGHKQLLRFLTLNAHTLVNPAVLSSMEKADLRGQVEVLSDLKQDSNEVSFGIKTNKGEGLLKFPKTFDLRMPVLEVDRTDEEVWRSVTVRLVIELPDDPKQGVRFALLAPEFDAIDRERMENEYGHIESEVGDKSLVLRGECGYTNRTVTIE